MTIAPQQDDFDDIEIHPAATIFPMMDGLEYELFKKDIEYNGQIEPVVFWCGQLLDGRNRYRACLEIGKEPWSIEIPEEIDPWKFVISHNLHRRHLSETQRAMVAARLANLEQGGDRKSGKIKTPIGVLKIEDAAEQLSVSPRSVDRAKKVLANGSPELIEACDKDRVAVSKAAKAAMQTSDPKEQMRIATDRFAKRQEVRDSESREVEAIKNWVFQFGTFQNQLAALKQLFSSVDSQVMGLVRHLVEVVDDGE